MVRYIVLVNFTEKGAAGAKDSAKRAKEFRESASKAGAQVEAVFWMIGPYDGLFILTAPDEERAAGIVLSLGKSGMVRTCMLRAFDEGEFKRVTECMG